MFLLRVLKGDSRLAILIMAMVLRGILNLLIFLRCIASRFLSRLFLKFTVALGPAFLMFLKGKKVNVRDQVVFAATAKGSVRFFSKRLTVRDTFKRCVRRLFMDCARCVVGMFRLPT